MTRFLVPLSALSILLTACGPSSTAVRVSLQEQLRNPFFDYAYHVDVAQHMTDLEINKDPIVENAEKKDLITRIRTDALKKSEQAQKIIDAGLTGVFVRTTGEYVLGQALLTEDALYLSADFEVDPSPKLELYLTTMIDPRDGTFPDESAIFLGELGTPYGAQEYALPTIENPAEYRTVVLYDALLGRPMAFAQLQ